MCGFALATIVQKRRYGQLKKRRMTQPSCSRPSPLTMYAHGWPLWSFAVRTTRTATPFSNVLTTLPCGCALTFNGVPVGSVTTQAPSCRVGGDGVGCGVGLGGPGLPSEHTPK